jgi:hypothetical protein
MPQREAQAEQRQMTGRSPCPGSSSSSSSSSSKERRWQISQHLRHADDASLLLGCATNAKYTADVAQQRKQRKYLAAGL